MIMKKGCGLLGIHCLPLAALALAVLGTRPALAQHEHHLTGTGVISPAQSPGADVLTRSYDIGRTGVNPRETVLTPANVGGLKKLFSLDVMDDPAHPNDPRLEAQPLIVTGITMSDGK